MSCCPPAPQITVVDISPDEPTVGPEIQRLPGESEDCFAARKGNTSETGQVDDKTEVVPGKINVTSIVTPPSRLINLQFGLTGGVVADHWAFTPASFTGVTMSTSTGLMSGTFDASYEGKKLTLRVQAYDSSNVLIDDRTYDFSPGGGSGSDTIQLQHPLPGSIVTSGFGQRKPPASGASSMHLALDFAYADRHLEDVKCAYDGEVVLARPGTGYGNYVLVKHVNAAGQHLITTCYAHLNSIYVKVGQKVVGGQALGREGNTGIGSGPHLHFEVRLPNGTRVDPTPYLKGAVQVANGVTSSNQPDGSGTTTVNGDRYITPAQVQARTSCAAFGPDYPAGLPPAAPPPVVTVPPSVGDDPFEKAWYFTMLHEVNAQWMTTPARSPSDSEVAAGLIATSDQRQRVGYVEYPKNFGSTTKFGVAQRFNPNVDIHTMDYATARSTGYNSYWLGNPDCSAMTLQIAVFMFDTKYLVGAGGAARIMTAAGVTGTETGAAALAAVDALAAARIAYLKGTAGFATYGRGWTNRVNDCAAYSKALT